MLHPVTSLLLRPAAVLLLFAAWTNPAFSVDWPDVTQAEMQMTSLPEQPGAPAVILVRDEVDDNTLNSHQVFMRIKVLTEAGRKYADVHVGYNRRLFTVRSVRGRTDSTAASSAGLVSTS